MKIEFNSIDKNIRIKKNETRIWLNKIAHIHSREISMLSYNFCSDDYLLDVNKKHLNHDYYTDIITFDLSETPSFIEGDIYISTERVKSNAEDNTISFMEELHRVMAHGLLHLIGFKDKTPKEIIAMRKAENDCLKLIKPSFT